VERHFGRHGDFSRVRADVRLEARAALGRLAAHRNLTITMLIEKLAADSERALLARLRPEQAERYLAWRATAPAGHREGTEFRERQRSSDRPRNSRLRDPVVAPSGPTDRVHLRSKHPRSWTQTIRPSRVNRERLMSFPRYTAEVFRWDFACTSLP
jgi:hypothetical protein